MLIPTASSATSQDFSVIKSIHDGLREECRHFNTIEAAYRGVASGWLIACVAGLGFIAKELPLHQAWMIPALCLAAANGVLFICALDLVVFQSLLEASFNVQLDWENRYRWLPQVAHEMQQIVGDSAIRIAWWGYVTAYMVLMAVGIGEVGVSLLPKEPAAPSVPQDSLFIVILFGASVVFFYFVMRRIDLNLASSRLQPKSAAENLRPGTTSEPESDLVREATQARESALASLSNFKVGAALMGDHEIYTGFNIENASYGLTMCAERVALYGALVKGARTFSQIVIVTDSAKPTPPCGACRQLLWEYCGDIEVTLHPLAGTPKTKMRLSSLLPEPFDGRSL